MKFSLPRTILAASNCKEALLEFSYLTSTLSRLNLMAPRVSKLCHPISFAPMSIFSHFTSAFNLLYLFKIDNYEN